MSKHFRDTARSTTVDLVGGFRSDRLLLTGPDAGRLGAALHRHLVRAASSPEATRVAELVGAALRTVVVVPPEMIPRDVITMRSRFVLEELDSGDRHEMALVYPEEEATEVGSISVLTPLGAALLGVSEGTVLGRRLPGGGTALLRVESIAYQPEDAREFHL
jgi:regulator of nucleoside diphosphate kinase